MLIYYSRFQMAFLLILSLFSLACCIPEIHAQKIKREAVLQAAIIVEPASQPTQFQTEKIQPGHSVKIALLVENTGNAASPTGKISVRFALAKPLDNEPKSMLFETEVVELPSIEPGHSLELSFKKTHQWPSISDFIREDWGMREYQAILNLENQHQVIGSLAVTFSAYYYPGIRKELPFKISLPFSQQP